VKRRNVHVATNDKNTFEVLSYDAEAQRVTLGSRYGAQMTYRVDQLRSNQYRIIPAVEVSIDGISAVIYKTADGRQLP